MNATLALAVTLVAAGFQANAGDATWLTSLGEAKTVAAKENKPILADFTGSDWCIWCIRLDDQVLSQKAFKDYAKDKLVLLKIDFLRKTKQDPEVKKANTALAKEYGVQGFPTVLLLDKDGKVLARTGFREGGAEPYVAHLKDLLRMK